MKGFPFKLAAEQGAYPRAGEPEGMAGFIVKSEDEGIAEHLAKRARLDLGTLRRWASAASLLPIRVELAARCVFHERLSH